MFEALGVLFLGLMVIGVVFVVPLVVWHRCNLKANRELAKLKEHHEFQLTFFRDLHHSDVMDAHIWYKNHR
jgi:hypothetical protein